MRTPRPCQADRKGPRSLKAEISSWRRSNALTMPQTRLHNLRAREGRILSDTARQRSACSHAAIDSMQLCPIPVWYPRPLGLGRWAENHSVVHTLVSKPMRKRHYHPRIKPYSHEKKWRQNVRKNAISACRQICIAYETCIAHSWSDVYLRSFVFGHIDAPSGPNILHLRALVARLIQCFSLLVWAMLSLKVRYACMVHHQWSWQFHSHKSFSLSPCLSLLAQ